MGTGSFPAVKSGGGLTLTPTPSSVVVKKEYSYTSSPPMGRTACTESQCLYKGTPLSLPFTVIVVLIYKHRAQQGGAFQITATNIAVWRSSVVEKFCVSFIP